MKKKTIVWIVGLLVLIGCAGAGGYYWYSQIKVPYDNSVVAFNKEKDIVSKKNDEVNKEIEASESVLASDKKPLEEKTFTDLQVAISEAKESVRKIPTVPNKIGEVKKETSKLSKELDYSTQLKNLKGNQIIAKNSIKQLEQLTNPTEDLIILKLKQIKEIEDIAPVTEEKDPNGNLNKAGGYTATIYFSSNKLDGKEIYGSDLIDKGTDAGGSIEVYPTLEDAIKRNDYLTGFDGGVLSSGSHTVLGTVVIRTSSKLTATQQKELESELVKVLTSLD